MPNQNPNPNQKPITNPELVEALKALHQENTPQNQGKVLGLVVERAVFLTPAVVTPASRDRPTPPGSRPPSSSSSSPPRTAAPSSPPSPTRRSCGSSPVRSRCSRWCSALTTTSP